MDANKIEACDKREVFGAARGLLAACGSLYRFPSPARSPALLAFAPAPPIQ